MLEVASVCKGFTIIIKAPFTWWKCKLSIKRQKACSRLCITGVSTKFWLYSLFGGLRNLCFKKFRVCCLKNNRTITKLIYWKCQSCMCLIHSKESTHQSQLFGNQTILLALLVFAYAYIQNWTWIVLSIFFHLLSCTEWVLSFQDYTSPLKK